MLTPGMFVRVRIQIGTYDDALLIPEVAIGRDMTGAFVFVVDNSNKAQRKPVKLGTKEGERIVIESGLEPTDKVIVSGIQRVRPDIEVQVEQMTNQDKEMNSESGQEKESSSDSG